MNPSCGRSLEAFHEEELRVALVEVLDDAARLESETEAEQLHRHVGLVRRREQLSAPRRRLDGIDQGGRYAHAPVARSNDEQLEGVVLEELAARRKTEELSVAVGDQQTTLALRSREEVGPISDAGRVPVEGGHEFDFAPAGRPDHRPDSRHLPSVQTPDDQRGHERGQVAVYAVLLFPMLMLVLSLVLAVGTIEGLRTRIRAQLDMAALTATQALDPAALAAGEPPRLRVAEAERLAREYLARNLAATGDVLVASPSEIAAAAQIVISNEPGTDPITGASNTAPTVSIEISAPARIPLLGLAGIAPIVTLTIDGSASART